MFSQDPINMTEDLVIEAVFGLGEGIVSGKIHPDNHIVSRDLKIKTTKVSDKKIAVVRKGSGKSETIKLSPTKSKEANRTIAVKYNLITNPLINHKQNCIYPRLEPPHAQIQGRNFPTPLSRHDPYPDS